MTYKLLVSTSGTGSRLGEITARTNKALVKIAGRPVLEHILANYPADLPVVLTVGYRADEVKGYVRKYLGDRAVEIAAVDLYEGPGSSEGYSLFQAREYLQCPFVYNTCDALVREIVPPPKRNWVGSYWFPEGSEISAYRTHQLEGDRLLRFNDKGEIDWAPVHIGVSGIHDYERFWGKLEKLLVDNLETNTALSDVHVLQAMQKTGDEFISRPFRGWLDTGNLATLERARAALEGVPG